MLIHELMACHAAGAFRKKGMEVNHVVAAAVIMLVLPAEGIIGCVPDMGKYTEAVRLVAVDPPQEFRVNRSAVVSDPFRVDLYRPSYLRFMCRHDVYQVAYGLGRMFAFTDMDVNTAAA